MAIGPVKPTPKPGMASKPRVAKAKPSKTPYVKSKTPGMQGGKTARIKADLQKAIKGGAAKTAKKLAPRDVLTQQDITKVYTMGNMKSGTSAVSLKPTKSTSPKQKAKRKMIAGNIINDKSKTAMRAKIVEMNATKKRK